MRIGVKIALAIGLAMLGWLLGLRLMEGAPERCLARAGAASAYQLAAGPQAELARIGWRLVTAPGGCRAAGLEPDSEIRLPELPAGVQVEPREPEQWALAKIDAAGAWRVTEGDPSVIVAVVDTGVDTRHPDLEGGWVQGYDYVDDDADPSDVHGHGTHVAGIILGRRNGVGIVGVCPRCSGMAVRVLGASGSGSLSNVAAGVIYAADHGARVINMSLGGPDQSQLLGDAVRYANGKGAAVIVAAGNDGSSIPQYPAAEPGALSVCASDSSDRLANFSNRYVKPDGQNLCAPGVSILSSVMGGTWQAWSGTSMASPNVAGTAGLIASAFPALSAQQIRDRLVSSGDQLVGLPFRRLNAGRALAGGTPPPGPTATRPAPPGPTVTPPAPGGGYVEEVVRLQNEARTQAGLAPLQVDGRLQLAAGRHARDMANGDFVSHTGSDGSTPWDRIARAGYPLITGGENVAGGYRTPADVVRAWLNSDGHRANILGNFRDIGCGYSENSAGRYFAYWACDFGTTSGGPPPPTVTRPAPTVTRPAPTVTRPAPTATRTPRPWPTSPWRIWLPTIIRPPWPFPTRHP